MALPWICVVPRFPDLPRQLLVAQLVAALSPDAATEAYAAGRIDKVRFTLQGFVVSGARLRGVAEAIRAGRIGVEVGGDTGPNFAAAYSSGPDRHITLGEMTGPPGDRWRATVVHEAIHAAFDLAGDRPPLEIDEAAAYLGETVWFRAGGLGFSVTAPPAAAAIYRAANEIVTRRDLHNRADQALTRADVPDLLATINAHPGYAPRPPPALPPPTPAPAP